MKKVFSLPAVLLSLALVLTGCTGGSPTSSDWEANGQNAPAPSPNLITKDVTTKDELSLSPAPPITGVQNYNWMVGAGELCVTNAKACPVVSEAENGEQISITGGGRLSPDLETFSGGGTFEYLDAQGNALGHASWEVIQLLNFHSYGEIDDASLPKGAIGGRLMARVHIVFDDGMERNGVLWVTCARGEHVPPGQRDGVELNVPGTGMFNEPISGGTAFVFDD